MTTRIAIKDICKVYDGLHSTPKKTKEGPIYLGVDAITDDGKIAPNQFSHLSEKDYRKWTKRVTPQYGDIVFSYEATLGRYALIPKGFYGCLGRRLAVIRNESPYINTTWLYYYFRSAEWANFIQSKIVKGSTVNRISIEDFPYYTIPYVPIEIQKLIADVLSGIDRKIQINIAVNDNLERQVKLLYDYWFTQFDFPNENGKPYRSSGGKMVWNEQLKREIPVGWSVRPLSKLCNILLGGTPSREIHEYWNGNIHWLNSGEVAQFPIIYSAERITQKGLDNSPAKLMPKGTTIVSITGNIRTSYLAIDTCANQSVVGVLESDIMKYPFLYQYLFRLISLFTTISTGNCQQHINKGTIEDALVVVPNNTVLTHYYQIVNPLYEMITKTSFECQRLIQIRDWLLPMLMNGQATVEG